MPNPPDRFPVIVDLSGVSTKAAVQTALQNAWDDFHTTYTVYPNTWVTYGNCVFLGWYPQTFA